MRAREFIVEPFVANANQVRENASSGATGSGSIATVAEPLGVVQRRAGDTFFTGKSSADDYPNTPDWIKQAKKQWTRKK